VLADLAVGDRIVTEADAGRRPEPIREIAGQTGIEPGKISSVSPAAPRERVLRPSADRKTIP